MYVPLYHAVRDFFRDHAKWAGQVVPIVFAGPDRAHQEMRRIMAEREQQRAGISQTEQANEDRPVPVPFMSLHITSPKFDPPRFNPHRFVIERNITTGTAKVARHMRPTTSDVQVDLWCGSAGGDLMAMSIEPQIELSFYADHRALHIDWSDPRWYRPPFNISEHVKWLGRTSVVLYTQGWEDTSDLETGDGPKEVRRTWRGRLDAYVPFRPEESRIVRTVPLEIIEPDTGEILGVVAGGVED
jgi:hypothetical protein